jgi:Transport and Golgi organisation 2
VCTVVLRSAPGDPLRILAVRDEFVSRAFDPPGAWWPEQPGVIGGRDRLAGGTWCASDPRTGFTALVLNRRERRTGTPTRGVLPLVALRAGETWPDLVDHRQMASFNLALAGPDGVTVWTWDAAELRRVSPTPGQHMITSDGVDADNPTTTRFAPLFETQSWYDVVTSTTPSDDPSALVVRHEVSGDIYATVFGQLITAGRGALRIASSATPWIHGSWTEQSWSQD